MRDSLITIITIELRMSNGLSVWFWTKPIIRQEGLFGYDI